jgi:hypothetical protein
VTRQRKTKQRMWVIRAGSRAEFATQFEQLSIVAIGWADMGDLGAYRDRTQLKARLQQIDPNQTPQQIAAAAGQIFTFVRTVQVGDMVLTPLEGGREIFVGTVIGEYQYDPDRMSNEYPHIRKVRWLGKINRAQVSLSFSNALRSPRAIYNVDKHIPEAQYWISEVTSEEIKLEVDFDRPGRIRWFGLERFKPFDDLVQIPLDSIAVIAGINSSGKSSLFGGLLALRQTLLSPPRISGKTALELRGAFVEVDRFDELVYEKKRRGSFIAQFRVPVTVPTGKLADLDIGILLQEKNWMVQSRFQFSYNSDRDEVTTKVELSAFDDPDDGASPIISLSIEPHGFQHRLELQIVGQPAVEAWAKIQFNRFIPIWEMRGRRAADESAQKRYRVYDLFRLIFKPALEVIEKELHDRIRYLGPLRDKPLRMYSYSGVSVPDVGEGGGSSVELLARNWDKPVWFVDLPKQAESQVVQWADLSPRQIKLGQAVNDALQWMGMQELNVREIAPNIAAQATLPTLSNPKTHVTIADVGFGVSQILPVITLALISSPEDILLFEQPESQLHPHAQGRLAELLICFARTGRRILIETHSDHLINRLRRLIAEDASNTLQNLVSILFVHPPSAGHGARIETLRVNEFGLIDNWPPNFLAETMLDAKAIIEAGLRKRDRDG